MTPKITSKTNVFFESLVKIVIISFIPFMLGIMIKIDTVNARVGIVETLLTEHKKVTIENVRIMGQIHHVGKVLECNNCHDNNSKG